MSKVFWMISLTDSNLFLIEFTFNWPKNKFLGCFDLIFFKKGKEIFSSFSWLSLFLSKEPSGKYLVVSEFDSVSETFPIKASLSRIIPSQVCLLRARIKFSAKILLPDVFRWSTPIIAMLSWLNFVMVHIGKIVFHIEFLENVSYLTAFIIQIVSELCLILVFHSYWSYYFSQYLWYSSQQFQGPGQILSHLCLHEWLLDQGHALVEAECKSSYTLSLIRWNASQPPSPLCHNFVLIIFVSLIFGRAFSILIWDTCIISFVVFDGIVDFCWQNIISF